LFKAWRDNPSMPAATLSPPQGLSDKRLLGLIQRGEPIGEEGGQGLQGDGRLRRILGSKRSYGDGFLEALQGQQATVVASHDSKDHLPALGHPGRRR
jgi:hypothetical protein